MRRLRRIQVPIATQNLCLDEIPAREDPIIHLRLFLPRSGSVWLVSEYDPETTEAFLYADLLGDPSFCEWGYTLLADLERDAVLVDESFTKPRSWSCCVTEVQPGRYVARREFMHRQARSAGQNAELPWSDAEPDPTQQTDPAPTSQLVPWRGRSSNPPVQAETITKLG